MPELPEVETLRKQLEGKVKGKKIKKVEVKDFDNFKGNKKDVLSEIKGIRRRAKLLIFDLKNNYSFVVHLKMTGYFYYGKEKETFKRDFTRVIFSFEDDSNLLFNDVRKFGYVKIMKTEKTEDYLEDYGVEPLSEKFTLNKFKELMDYKKRSTLKTALMDQSVIAGIGNIYSSEACYCAGVKPDRKINSLKEEEIKRLYDCIQKVLKEAIKYKGSSADTYVQLSGEKGKMVPRLKVYRKDKDPKGHKVKAKKIGGRTAYYCDKCQS